MIQNFVITSQAQRNENNWKKTIIIKKRLSNKIQFSKWKLDLPEFISSIFSSIPSSCFFARSTRSLNGLLPRFGCFFSWTCYYGNWYGCQPCRLSVADTTHIDLFHKWLPIINSFVIIKISLTNLVFELIIQKNFYSQTSSVRLI